MILLDTSIGIINARPAPVLERFRQDRRGEIGVCSVVAAELAHGVAKSHSGRNSKAPEMFLAPLSSLPLDAAAIGAYGEPRAELERRGSPIGSLDTMVAAHGLGQQAPLVTHNCREYAKVTGLRPETGALKLRRPIAIRIAAGAGHSLTRLEQPLAQRGCLEATQFQGHSPAEAGSSRNAAAAAPSLSLPNRSPSQL